MATSRNSQSYSVVQRLQRKRRYEVRCAIRQHDENAWVVRENEYLKKFVEEYESLARIQGLMRRRMNEICEKGAEENMRKSIYDAIYRIEAEKNKQAYASLMDYKRRIEHMRLNVQAQYLGIRRRDEEGETCPNCGVKRMRVRTRPTLPFWEVVRNAPPVPGEPRPHSKRKELCAIRLVE